MKNKVLNHCLILLLAFPAVYGGEKHQLFSEILRDYVHDGLVNYRGLKEDSRLDTYIAGLARTNPDTIAGEAVRLAFWINVYNAYTLKIICDNYPLESINDLHFGGLIVGTVLKKTVWDKDFVVINGKKLTLNQVEHDIIRPVYKDPRAHFGLVCASIGCPPLREEAFEADRLGEQLDDQGRRFFRQTDKNHFDLSGKVATLSKIFDWFSEDFGENDREILLFVAQFLPEDIAKAIRSEPGQWKIKHSDYDWKLNAFMPETN